MHHCVTDLAPIYEHLCALLGWPVDAAQLTSMREKNAAKLQELDAKLADAEANMGEQEVRDALLARAEHLAALGDKEAATAAFAATEAKTAGVGNKMDLVFSQIRWGGGPIGRRGHGPDLVCGGEYGPDPAGQVEHGLHPVGAWVGSGGGMHGPELVCM